MAQPRSQSKRSSRPRPSQGQAFASPPPTAQGEKRPTVAVKDKAPPQMAPREKSSAKMNASSDRCSDILERASLGEPLSPEKMSYLKKECGR
ncbi:MAG: hypothetical protein IPL03_13600 [Sterolibacteriaceae bacterium]|nr:hypothetical protein [Candidatus Methylophosphatis haderslevensis]